MNVQFFFENSRAYPPLLRQVNNRPGKLFYKGNEPDPRDIYIAIVGTRHPSIYGQQMAEKFATELSQLGFVIVSGLAYGIDAIAHSAALKVHPQKRTIAVLGSGLNHIVPASNIVLAEQIIKTGTILSEYPPDMAPHKGMFPARNRIIAGMSLATLVIEAPEKSGALITARLALDFNREVFTIPANITQESSLGTNRLIRDSKAHPVLTVHDILQILMPKLPREYQSLESGTDQLNLPLPYLSEEENLIYEQIKNSTLSQDEVARITKLPSSKVASIVSILELKGLVKTSGAYILTTR